ncbi:hypothetical protein [Pacificibacter marinus]|nr:hypothetical protein [Pacificibacter marinus]
MGQLLRSHGTALLAALVVALARGIAQGGDQSKQLAQIAGEIPDDFT